MAMPPPVDTPPMGTLGVATLAAPPVAMPPVACLATCRLSVIGNLPERAYPWRSRSYSAAGTTS